MRVGSVFTGVAGMDLGVLPVIGGELAWCAEVDPHASLVLERHGHGPNLGDVREIDWSEVEPVDLLIGGPPCQAVSVAGRRRGWADEKWMWPEAFRAMRELRPPMVMWENPTGLLTGRPKEDDDATGGDLEPRDEDVGRAGVDAGWFGHVLGEMAEMGYVGRWCCLRSSDVGAPHRRERIFIVARNTDGARAHTHTPAGASRGPARQPSGRPAGRPAADAPDLGHERGGAARRRGAGPANGGVAAADAEGGSDAHEPVGRPAERQPVGPVDRAGGGVGDGSAPEGVHRGGRPAGLVDWGRYRPAIDRWAAILGRPAPHPVDDRGRLNPPFVEWMMGYPEGWVTGLMLPDTDPRPSHLSRTQALKALGNGCQPQVAALAAELLVMQ